MQNVPAIRVGVGLQFVDDGAYRGHEEVSRDVHREAMLSRRHAAVVAARTCSFHLKDLR